MHNITIYLFPLAFDIIVSVALFAGRHSLAERGMDTGTVGSVLFMYGTGYIVASLLMGRIIRPAIARFQMIGAVLMAVATLIVLANIQSIRVIQGFFLVLPFAGSFFFNAYQSFMLGFDSSAGKPLTKTVAHYTGAWSIGYALGPLVASLLRKNLDWSSAYYAAACVAACIGLAALFFRSPNAAGAVKDTPDVPANSSRSFAIAALIGTITGWTALNMIFIYWPVHAESLSLDVRTKGMVEFCFAMSQSFFAFMLVAVPPAYYYSRRLPFAGLFGIVSVMLFAFSSNKTGFILAAIAFGCYTAHILNAMVFHSMVEKDRAVKRVAINEVCVGISFMLALPISNAIRRFFPAFTGAYVCIAVFIAAGVFIEWIVVNKLKAQPSLKSEVREQKTEPQKPA